MKRWGLYLSLCVLVISANASAKVMPKFVPQETKLYDFSDEVMSAVEHCSEYKTEIPLENTPYAHLGDFAGKTKINSELQIYGIKHGFCRIRVRISALGKGETRFNCRLDEAQRVALLNAMKDKSTEEYVITLPTPSEQDCSGCNEAVSFSGNLFDTTLAILKDHSCVERHIQPTKDEIKAARDEGNKLSDEFVTALKSCKPATETRKTSTLEDEIQVIGTAEDGKMCRIKYFGFEMPVNKRLLQNIDDHDDMKWLLLTNLDKAQYRYENKYDSTGMLFALAECQNENGSYSADENIVQRGSMQARTGLKAKHQNNVCLIELKNTVSVADIYFRDYSILCSVSDAYRPRLVGSYLHLIDEMEAERIVDEKGVTHIIETHSTPETLEADATLFKRIKDRGLCSLKPPSDPIKLEVDRFLYRDAPVSK